MHDADRAHEIERVFGVGNAPAVVRRILDAVKRGLRLLDAFFRDIDAAVAREIFTHIRMKSTDAAADIEAVGLARPEMRKNILAHQIGFRLQEEVVLQA